MAKGTVNKVILLGRLGNDPEVRTTQNGMTVANLSIATNDGIGDKMTTEWHRVVVFGKSAEAIQKYTSKGSQLYIEGRLSTNKYQDKNGQTQYTTNIVASSFQFIGGGNGGQSSGSDFESNNFQQNKPAQNNYSQPKPKNNVPDFAEINSTNFDDDIPF